MTYGRRDEQNGDYMLSGSIKNQALMPSPVVVINDLTFTTPWAISADDKSMIYFFYVPHGNTF